METLESELSSNFRWEFERFRSTILKKILEATPLPSLLEDLVLGIQAFDSSISCSILLLENGAIKHGAAPSLPTFYNQAITGIKIGPEVGSCGTAMYTGKRVIVNEIVSHPYWSLYKDIAEQAGLRSCWSEPIVSSSGSIIGSFAIYHSEVSEPDKRGIYLIEESATLASIAIERTLTNKQLQDSELRFRTFFEKNSCVMLLIDIESLKILDANYSACQFYGYSREELLDRIVPELRTGNPLPFPTCDACNTSEQSIHLVDQHKLANGDIRDVELHFSPILLNGQNLHFCIIHDISDRIQSQNTIQSLLNEKELILKEVHHRMKNNFLILFNLLDFQAQTIEDERAKWAIQNASHRVRTLSILYEKLYQTPQYSESSLSAYVTALVDDLSSLFPNHIHINKQISDSIIPSDRLQNLGIITTELLTNAIKYAKPEANEPLSIQLLGELVGQNYQMTFRDNGRGFTFQEGVGSGFGLELVQILTKQLRGTLEFDTKEGTSFLLRFPISKYKKSEAL